MGIIIVIGYTNVVNEGGGGDNYSKMSWFQIKQDIQPFVLY